MADIAQTTQASSDMIQTMFASRMTDMIVLDLVVAVAILLAHRWFVVSERKANATLESSNGSTGS